MDKKQQLLDLLKKRKNEVDQQNITKKLENLLSTLENEDVSLKGEKGDQGEKGESGTKGDKGIDGKNGRDGKDGKNGFDGFDGKDGNDGLAGKDGKNGLDGSPDSAFDVRNKLELLDGEERLDLKSVKGVDKLRDNLLQIMQEGLMSLDKNKVLGIRSNGVQVGFANELNISGATISNNSNQGVDISITSSSLGLSTYGTIPITGTVDGSNLNFTVPIGTTVTQLYNGTQFQTAGINYNQVGTAVTFTSGNAPVVINGQPTLSLTAFGSIAAVVAPSQFIRTYQVATYTAALALATGATPFLVFVAMSPQFNNSPTLYIYDGVNSGRLSQIASLLI